jgi:cell division protease FtsH
MEWLSGVAGYELAALGGLVAGVAVTMLAVKYRRWPGGRKTPVFRLIEAHFRPVRLDNISISERQFPFRVRADLQRAVNQLFSASTKICHFCGVRKEYAHEGLTLPALLINNHDAAVSVPPQYEDIDVGDEQPVRCLKNGLWLLQEGPNRFAVLLAPVQSFREVTGIQFQIATVNGSEGTGLTERFFKHLEDSLLKAESYRGKILSLEQQHSYSGEASGITVHKLRTVERDQVILPRSTLELLERNVIQFVRQRSRLGAFGQATKKGLLFYGPPGTGKTHTIHYLAKALAGHTTLLITAEQVGLLSEYMSLARLLQPSIVVLEDVDLIAKDRTRMGSPCEEVLLNKLLNEMDGLKEEADILYILTTNSPETLEAALSSRPGRIDQAIEFPLPDDEGREKLIRLYAHGVETSDEMIRTTVQRTEKVSPAFIKELMRRSVQFHLERSQAHCIEAQDVEKALEEMLFNGGSLNLKLLGGQCGRSSLLGFARAGAS